MITVQMFPRIQKLMKRVRRRFFPTRFDRILAVHGWTSESQLRYLMNAVRSLPDRAQIVEVGVWQGRSALAMAEACCGTNRKVFAVDPWEAYDQAGANVESRLGEWGQTSFQAIYEAFQKNRQDLRLEPWLTPVRLESVVAAQSWSHGPVQMLFIDGNHDYDAVTADLKVWFPLVSEGGLICGDDWNWETTQAAVTDFLARSPNYRLTLPAENTWAFQKA